MGFRIEVCNINFCFLIWFAVSVHLMSVSGNDYTDNENNPFSVWFSFKHNPYASSLALYIVYSVFFFLWASLVVYMFLFLYISPFVTHLVVLGVRLQQAVLLYSHRRRQRNSISPLLSFLLAAALHAWWRRLGQGAAAQTLVTHTLERGRRKEQLVKPKVPQLIFWSIHELLSALTSSRVSSCGVAALSSESFCEPWMVSMFFLVPSRFFLCLWASFLTCPSALPELSLLTGLVSHFLKVFPGRLGPGELWGPRVWLEPGWRASLLDTDKVSDGKEKKEDVENC